MIDQQNPGATAAPAASAAPMTAEAATAQKAALMADPAWRAGAMQAGGQQWAELSRLNEAIAAAHPEAESDDDEEAFAAAAPPAAEQPDEGDDEDDNDDPAALAAIHRVPERPGQYDLPQQLAEQSDLKTDPGLEIELRMAFHAAEVPQSLAQLMYMAAITAAKEPDQSPASVNVRMQAEYQKSAHSLHRKWGAEYDANLAAANAEARQIFDKLPHSMTKGCSYDDWCRSSGIANNRVVVEQLFNRARARRA